jgi:uncharacterized repeat protein (TIGR02543 family)
VNISIGTATITFDTDGGSAIDPITLPVGTPLTKPEDPTKDGYTFDGWEPEFPDTMPAQSVVLKAKWTKNPDPAPEDTKYDDLTPAEKANADKLAGEYATDKDTSAAMLKTGESLGAELDTMLLSTKKLTNLPNDNDPKGTKFERLRAKAVKRTGNTMVIQWKTISQADGYLIYTNKCGKQNKLQLKKVITNSKTSKWKRTKLKKQTYYKFIVVAYKNVKGERLPIAASVGVHSTTKAKKSTIAKAVKVNKKSVTLKVGQTFKIKAKEVKAEKGKKIKKHRAINYESNNPAVASVGKATGKIKAVKKGTTYVYVYAQDGVYARVKVTVK